jgi:hypothetical protein
MKLLHVKLLQVVFLSNVLVVYTGGYFKRMDFEVEVFWVVKPCSVGGILP